MRFLYSNFLVNCFFAEQKRNVKLQDCPHYSDTRFNKPQVIFGEKIDGLIWDYDDRLRQWDYKKHEHSWETAKSKKNMVFRSANFYQKYLCEYFGKRVKLVCVMGGVNLSSGYPYLVFGYQEVSSEKRRKTKTEKTEVSNGSEAPAAT